MNRWFVVYINLKKNKLSKHWRFDSYPEACLYFCEKVPVVVANGTNLKIDNIILTNGWYSHSGYIIIDSKRCKTEWVLNYIRPLMIEERNKVIDSLLD